MHRITRVTKILPSRSSPKSSTRACLCQDRNTYSKECCKGAMMNQGIGNVTGSGS